MLFQFDLFNDPFEAPAIERPAPRKVRLSAGWQVADHACRFCFGRVLQRVHKGEAVEVRCAECGKRADGAPKMLCCCGADCGDLGLALECVKNPQVTNENPHEILVRERRVDVAEQSKAPARPVKLPGY